MHVSRAERQRRFWLVALNTIGVLALLLGGWGCDAPPPAAGVATRPPASPATSNPGSPVAAGPSPTANPVVEVPNPTPNPVLDNAEGVVFTYYQALGQQAWAAARQFLTPELQAQLTEAALEASMAGTDAVGLVVIIPQSVTPDRVRFDAIVSARSIPNAPGEYQFGANPRYVEAIRTPDGWRISRISPTPFEDR